MPPVVLEEESTTAKAAVDSTVLASGDEHPGDDNDEGQDGKAPDTTPTKDPAARNNDEHNVTTT